MTISVKKKEEFLRWLLNHHQLKRRESVWILNYLVNHEDILKNVTFTEMSQYCQNGRALRIACQGVKTRPVSFFKNGAMITDPEKCFHDIRLNKEKPLLLDLHFPDRHTCLKYWGVFEDNPHLNHRLLFTARDDEELDSFLEYTIEKYRLDKINEEIDKALDENDREVFNKICYEKDGHSVKLKTYQKFLNG